MWEFRDFYAENWVISKFHYPEPKSKVWRKWWPFSILQQHKQLRNDISRHKIYLTACNSVFKKLQEVNNIPVKSLKSRISDPSSNSDWGCCYSLCSIAFWEKYEFTYPCVLSSLCLEIHYSAIIISIELICYILTFDPAQKCYSKVIHRKELTHSNGQ